MACSSPRQRTRTYRRSRPGLSYWHDEQAQSRLPLPARCNRQRSECEVAAGRAGLEIPAPSPVSKQHCSGKCARFVGVPAVEQPPARGICECDILEQRMSRVQRSRVLRLL